MRFPFAATYAGRSVLVTGHTGFKGSWLAIWLHQLGAQVAGYSLAAPTTPSNFEVSRVRELLSTHREADVRDFDCLRETIARTEPEVVFHLAAQPLVRKTTPRLATPSTQTSWAPATCLKASGCRGGSAPLW